MEAEDSSTESPRTVTITIWPIFVLRGTCASTDEEPAATTLKQQRNMRVQKGGIFTGRCAYSPL